MEESLKKRTLKGVSWSFVDNIAGSGISFLVGLVLARLLSPSEFGIIGMITIFIAISNSIVDSGFSNALIRKIDAEKKDYDTVFFFNLIVSIFLYILLFLSAPAISRFYKEPQLISVTRVFQYKCDEFYHPEAEGAIMWDDPDLAIEWSIKAEDIELSEKDKIHPFLKDFDTPFVYNR